MRAFKTVGIQVAIGASLSAAIAVGIFACAGSGAPPSQPDSALAPGEVVDVLVESSDGGTTVTVGGPVEPVMNTHSETDPDRVVVDLANVKPGQIQDAIPVHDGRGEGTRVAPPRGPERRGPTAVEIVLAPPSDPHVTAGPEGVVIQLSPVGQAASAEDPWTGPAADETAQAEGGGAGAWARE